MHITLLRIFDVVKIGLKKAVLISVNDAIMHVAWNLTTLSKSDAHCWSLGTESRNTPLPTVMSLIPERWSVADRVSEQWLLIVTGFVVREYVTCTGSALRCCWISRPCVCIYMAMAQTMQDRKAWIHLPEEHSWLNWRKYGTSLLWQINLVTWLEQWTSRSEIFWERVQQH
jgi:hypothetical protein